MTDDGFGFAVGLGDCGLIFCGDAVVGAGAAAVVLYVVLGGLTAGFVVANVAATVVFKGRNDVIVVYGLGAVAAGFAVSWLDECGPLDDAVVELGTENWTVGLTVWGLGF